MQKRCASRGFEGGPDAPSFRPLKTKPNMFLLMEEGRKGSLYVERNMRNGGMRKQYVKTTCRQEMTEREFKRDFLERIYNHRQRMEKMTQEMKENQEKEDASLFLVLQNYKTRMQSVNVTASERMRITSVQNKIDDLDEQGQLAFATWLRDASRSYERTKPPYRPSGLKWREVGTERPLKGKSVVNDTLVSALKDRKVFDEQEWKGFGVGREVENFKLSFEDFVFVQGIYFRPDEEPIWKAWTDSSTGAVAEWKLQWFSMAHEQLDILKICNVQIGPFTSITQCYPSRLSAFDVINQESNALETLLVQVVHRSQEQEVGEEEGSEEGTAGEGGEEGGNYSYCIPYEHLLDVKKSSDYTQEVNDRRSLATGEYVYERKTNRLANYAFFPDPSNPSPSPRRTIPVCRLKRLVDVPSPI